MIRSANPHQKVPGNASGEAPKMDFGSMDPSNTARAANAEAKRPRLDTLTLRRTSLRVL